MERSTGESISTEGSPVELESPKAESEKRKSRVLPCASVFRRLLLHRAGSPRDFSIFFYCVAALPEIR